MKYIIRTLFIIVIFIAALPGGLYIVGIYMVEGKPFPPSNLATTEEQEKIFLHIEKNIAETKVLRLNPWSYSLMLITQELPQGIRPSSLVARNYNQTHIKNHRMLYWHLSDASMTIWVSRNWTSEQILTKVYELYNNEIASNQPFQLSTN
jgi:hypothetical protein